MNRSTSLSCKNISFSYNDISGVLPAVNDFSATFHAGRFYGVLGANGCGKTTLLDLLLGTKKTAQGTVFLNGKNITTLSKRVRAKEMTLVPQQHNSGFGYTVEEIVMMGRNPHMRRFATPTGTDWQCVEQSMIELGITNLRHRMITQLSGGQQQRVIVARAFAQQAPIMLFDEATANLDIKYAIQILSLARKRVAKGSTVIAVLHDLNLAAAFCDNILFMQEGCLRFFGKTEEVLTAEVIKEIYDVKSRIIFDNGLRVHFCYDVNCCSHKNLK